MSIKYCDYTNGDDDTGDGTSGNPYKTIQKSDNGLSGGDEIRVAKSPASSDLTGTVGFTKKSGAVTGSGTSFTTELAIGDFIKGGDGNWYEVITITNDTSMSLYKVYPGATESGVSSQKLGITSTGEAPSTTTKVQQLDVSGSSTESMLKVSGGWDLSTETQDGQTYFRQMHGTFATRNGYGLYAHNYSYIEIERLHFLRYRYGLHFYNCHDNKITGTLCASCYSYGLYLSTGYNFTFTDCVSSSNNSYGLYLSGASHNIITDLIAHSNETYGLYLSSSRNNLITSPSTNCGYIGIHLAGSNNNVFNSPGSNNNIAGVMMVYSNNNVFNSPTFNDNPYGFYIDKGSNNIANNYNSTGTLGADVNVLSGRNFGEFPSLKCQHFRAVGANKCFYEYGTTERDTADARSTQCLKYDPSSGAYYISQSFFFKADSGVAQTLSAYIKKSSAFNGDVQAAIYFLGEKITGWTAVTPSADDTYEQGNITASAGDITEDGVIELRIKVRGSAGDVFVDDLETA